jgi:hypothetical protein
MPHAIVALGLSSVTSIRQTILIQRHTQANPKSSAQSALQIGPRCLMM